jgi:tetratricopeptide (TPR) repeat protein/tRNA A-37 threonylcarbamoyl transferase component Bud32
MSTNQADLDSLVLAALEFQSPNDRAAFLDASCGADHELRAQAERLLRLHEHAGNFLQQPPAEVEATIVSDGACQNLSATVDAGLSPTLADEPAVGIGNARQNLRKNLALSMEVPRGMVTGVMGTIGDSIMQPKSAEIPQRELGSRYQLQGEIARGGMGIIYRATDTVLGREVAVKVLQEKYTPESVAAVRFFGEARITGQLQHPSIPPVHDLGTLADGRPFLAMKLIKGQTLEELLKAGFDPSAERGRFVAAFEQICQALAYAHSRGVIHRDLKPSNVMVGAFGEIQVMDWGLAKVLGDESQANVDALSAEHTRASTRQSAAESGSQTQDGSLVGTPAFIAPEQAVGQVERVNERSDVFGLGAILAVILTGEPPYVGETFESVRVQAVRGKLEDCFARLDASGAEPELVALAKKCLAYEPADRPKDAGAVAQAVDRLRAAADERARRAELERVRLEGEQATAAARAAELRKRRLLALGAVAALAVATVGGLTAVLAVQRRANADLAAKNAELAGEQAKVQARFEVAQKAIALFHTGVSEDALLKNPEFKELRTKLLKEAAGFYADLEKLLAGQTDAKSRKALAAAYFELGELTDKIGTKPDALSVHRKALAARRELAAAKGVDLETRLDVARSLRAEGILLYYTGDPSGALRAWEEQRDIATALEAESATSAVRAVLARSQNTIAVLLMETGKPAEALQAFQKALSIQQKLADANPAVTGYQYDMALSYNNIGTVLVRTGKPKEALAAWHKALAINQKLADANPTSAEFQSALAGTHNNIVELLSQTGRSAEVLQAHQKALAIRQKLADANPAVAEFQSAVAASHSSIGYLLSQTGRLAEAQQAHQKALAIRQRLADANPAVTKYQRATAQSHNLLGRLLARQQRFAEAFITLDAGLAVRQKLAKADPKNTEYATDLGYSYAYRGWALIRSEYADGGSKAAGDLRQAVELWSRASAPNTETRFERSRALAILAGLGLEAKSGVTKSEAARFADLAVAALRDAFHAGWNQRFELKEPDFDALRSREDFQKLVADVAAKAEKPSSSGDAILNH